MSVNGAINALRRALAQETQATLEARTVGAMNLEDELVELAKLSQGFMKRKDDFLFRLGQLDNADAKAELERVRWLTAEQKVVVCDAIDDVRDRKNELDFFLEVREML
jgi:hypothetical protein